MSNTYENNAASPEPIPHVGEAPFNSLPNKSIFEKDIKIGTQGAVFTLKGDESHVVKTHEVRSLEDTVPFNALVNRISDIQRYYPNYKERYPNIMFPEQIFEYKGASELYGTSRYVDFVMERTDSDLQQLLSTDKLSEQDLKDVLEGTANSLEQLLSMGITHGDVKLANFLYSRENGRIHVYITDFSNCKVLPYKPDEPDTVSQETFVSKAKVDRNHFYNELLCLLRGGSSEKESDLDYIANRYGSSIVKLLEEFNDSSGDLMHYSTFASKVEKLYPEH